MPDPSPARQFDPMLVEGFRTKAGNLADLVDLRAHLVAILQGNGLPPELADCELNLCFPAGDGRVELPVDLELLAGHWPGSVLDSAELRLLREVMQQAEQVALIAARLFEAARDELESREPRPDAAAPEAPPLPVPANPA